MKLMLFEIRERGASPLTPWFVQLIVAPIVVDGCGILLLEVFALALKPLVGNVLEGAWDVASLSIFPIIGIAIGSFAAHRWPRSVPVGLWAWVLPVTVLICSVIRSLHEPLMRSDLVLYYLYSTGPSEGMARLLESEPALSATGYSLGLYLASRRRRGGRSTSMMR
jgi:hypothetical protein